jgi:GR25 family glycosyltransferase involved in LPS biosynthesis
MKILVIHYDKLVERKRHMLNEFQKHNLENSEFVSNHGKDRITLKEKSRFKNLTDGEISLMLHHFECYKIISEKYDYAIIFEDDVILADDFRNKIEKYISELPDDWDMLFFGEGHGVHIPKFRLIPDVNIYKKMTDLKNNIPGGIDGSTRCADSYIVSKKCAQRMVQVLNSIKIISIPLDHLLNKINHFCRFNIYWAEPTLAIQGTSNGMFKTSVR